MLQKQRRGVEPAAQTAPKTMTATKHQLLQEPSATKNTGSEEPAKANNPNQRLKKKNQMLPPVNKKNKRGNKINEPGSWWSKPGKVDLGNPTRGKTNR